MDFNMEIFCKITKNNKTIKQILKEDLNISDRLLIYLKKHNLITYNQEQVQNINQYPNVDDTIKIDLSFEEDNNNIVPKQMDLNILFEDDWLLIVNKPAGIAVHPSILHYEDSLSNGIKAYFDKINLHKKIRPVNRLDRNTSGIVIFAKNQYIQENLVYQMEKQTFKKRYIAIVEGHIPKRSGIINAPIARKENSIIERCVSENGKKAITHYNVLYSNVEKNFDVVECLLETGRTHQIRVHFAYLNHPLLGDTLYGNASNYINRQALHAYKVEFIHPITKEQIHIVAELPDDFCKDKETIQAVKNPL